MPLRTSSQGRLFFKGLMSSGPDISGTQDVAAISADHRRSVLLPSSLPSPSPSPSSVSVFVSSVSSVSPSSSSSSPSPVLYRTRSDGASLLAIDADLRRHKSASSSSHCPLEKRGGGGGGRRRASSDTVQNLSGSDSTKVISLGSSEATIAEALEQCDDDNDASGSEKLSSLSADRSDVLSMARYEDLLEEKHGLLSSLTMDPPDFVQIKNQVGNEGVPEKKLGSSSLLVLDQPDHVPGKERSGALMQGFTSEDGEVFSSTGISSTGVPVACNGRGCRPLTSSERKTLGFLESDHGSGHGYGDGDGVGSGYGDGDGENVEAYYQRLLQSDPQNPLLLRNYAQFLSEKKGDFKRSEEYYERAILAEPNDGEVLSQYAQLQWSIHGDKDRAETYYNQAIEAAPEDCYVMASYASFLWDAEDDEETGNRKPALPLLPALHETPTPLLASA